ncbi:MAG: exodeoxyribonuclease III [Alphaproteobacteria bacterium]|nr:exodeoxyribonuclease III [Alphaproteobacteria bacterium]
MRIATWNINSVRLRIAHITRFVIDAKPDVLCLQEIKCRDGEFPLGAFADAGLRHVSVVGQKGWHGVAIASRKPIERLPPPPICPRNEARSVAVRTGGVEIHTLYVPAGGDEPDVATNPKFAHKLDVLAQMKTYYASRKGRGPLIVTGDLNVAPGEHDVWSHKQLLNVVSHTPAETSALEAARTAGGLVDLARVHHPADEKVYTWWSYRNSDWAKSNRGRRLDHIWTTPELAAASSKFTVHAACRDWEKPSDHAPVSVTINI